MDKKPEKLVPEVRFKGFTDDWEQRKLGEVTKVTMGQSPSSKNYTDNPNDYVLVQGNADLKSNEISPRVWTKEVTKQVHKGEFIITVRAPVGYLAMANMDAVIGRGVAAIDGNKYLYYLLQTKLLDRTWEKLSSGSTFESISSNDIKNLEIKVTETEEEKLIAKLMDTVTYFVTLQQRKLEQLKQLKTAMLQQLFVDKNSKQPNLRFKNFNGNWKERKLGELYSYHNGRAHEQNQKSNGKYELINLNSISIDGTLKSSGRYINHANEILRQNDLVMILSDIAHGKLLGRVAIIPQDNKYVLNQRVALLRPTSKNINSNFMVSLINNNQRYFHKMGIGTSQLNISKSTVTESLWQVPKIKEQLVVGKFLQNSAHVINLQQSKIDQLNILKKYLLQKLFI